jgi:hypothetical protein
MISTSISKELHSILWSKPFVNNGLYDGGWNCRDHALVIGGLISILGRKIGISHGKNMMVKGPTKHFPPIGYGQDGNMGAGHSWIVDESLTIFDYSLKLPKGKKNKQWKSYSDPIVENTKCNNVKGATIVVTNNLNDYESEIASSTHIDDGFRIIYYQEKYELFNPSKALDPFHWIDSPLSNKMKLRYPKGIYVKIIMHLHELISGKAKSVAKKSQIGAWNTISKRSEEDIQRYVEIIEERY